MKKTAKIVKAVGKKAVKAKVFKLKPAIKAKAVAAPVKKAAKKIGQTPSERAQWGKKVQAAPLKKKVQFEKTVRISAGGTSLTEALSFGRKSNRDKKLVEQVQRGKAVKQASDLAAAKAVSRAATKPIKAAKKSKEPEEKFTVYHRPKSMAAPTMAEFPNQADLASAHRVYLKQQVRMVCNVPPGESEPGPFCEVIAKCGNRVVKLWVRVLQGNERNGIGYVHANPQYQHFQAEIGTDLRWAGGTAECLAKIVEVLGMRIERKAVPVGFLNRMLTAPKERKKLTPSQKSEKTAEENIKKNIPQVAVMATADSGPVAPHIEFRGPAIEIPPIVVPARVLPASAPGAMPVETTPGL